MMPPRRSTLLKTLLLVFIAGLCLFPKDEPKLVLPQKTVVASSKPRIEVKTTEEKTEAAPYQFGSRFGHETDPVLADFANWSHRYIATKDSALIPQGIALAKERRLAVFKLIRNQPKLALAQTPPYSVRSQLPSQITDQLEQPIDDQGDLLVLGRTDAKGTTIARRANINGQSFDAFVYGDRLSQTSSRNISLHGVALDGALAVSESPLRVLEDGEPVPADKTAYSASCPISGKDGSLTAISGKKVIYLCCGGHIRAASDGVTHGETTANDTIPTTGPHTVLVMMVDFSDAPGAIATTDAANTLLNNLDNFYRQSSYGDFWFTTKTVTPLLHINHTRAYYSEDKQTGDSNLLDDARAAAVAAGFDPNIFDLDAVAFPYVGFPWVGQGYVGIKGAWVQDSGNFNGDVFGHEFGHNLGLWHANSWVSSTIIGQEGVDQHREYGNPFDMMSNGAAFPLRHYNSNFKLLLNWLPSRNIITATNSGTYRIYAQDQAARATDRFYGLRIPVDLYIQESVEDYWIEFRQLLAGRYPATANAPIIAWGNDVGTEKASRLLDMTPETADFTDSPLPIGRTFHDVDHGVEITPIAKGGVGADAYIDLQINLSLAPVLSIADAVEATNLTFTTSSTNPWTGEHTVSHDGIDAATSGPTRDGGSSYVETTVTGPGGISFWWKVSSEQDFDFLRFKVDGGDDFAAISGEAGWEFRAFEIPAGQHTLRWVYDKDQTTSSGADRGWLDQVTFTVGDRAPSINVQPVPAFASAGDTVSFQVTAGGSDPLHYQWLYGPGEIPGATNSTLVITNVQTTQAGKYSVVVSNPYGSVTSSNVLLTVYSFVSLADALDLNVNWDTVGNVKWRGETQVTFDSVDAAQSGAITDDQSSSLTTTLTGPGNLSFYWKVSSEVKFDPFSFYMDGALIDTISGEVDWTQKSLLIPNGAHILRWTYAKDKSLGKGADAAWVDQVTFTPSANLPATINTQPADQSVSVGGTAIFRVGYAGSDPLGFQWFLNNNPLNARPGVTGVNASELTISNVQSTDAGKYTVLVQNGFGQQTSLPATLSIVPLSLADAVDEGAHAWTTGGTGNTNFWRGIFTTTHTGANGDVASNMPITNNISTWIQTELDGPATVSFWWKVSSETNYDFLSVQIDGLQADAISGEVDWTKDTVNIPAGHHFLRWTYAKDSSTFQGLDTAWLDEVQIIGAPTGPNITSLTLDNAGLHGAIENLQGAKYILESSMDLTNWTPLSTNIITSSSATFVRPTANAAEFLRVRTE